MSAEMNRDDRAGGGFFGWWFRELAEILGAKPNLPDRSLDKALIVRLSDGGLELAHVKKGRVSLIGEAEFPKKQRSNRGAGELIPLNKKVAKAIKSNRYPVILRLPPKFGMLVDDFLPRSAINDVRSIITHKIDLLTPWSSDQVHFDHRVFDCGQDDKIGVKLAIAPRRIVSELSERLAAVGLKPDLIDIEEDQVWRPADYDLKNSGLLRAKRPVGAIMFCVLAVSLVAAGSGYFTRNYLQENILFAARDQYRQALQGRIADIPELATEIEAKRGDAGFVGLEKASNPSGLIVLEMLSRIMPENSWISDFSLNGTVLIMNGYALDASRIPALLEASRHFSDVQFHSPSTRVTLASNDGTDIEVERFGVEASVAPIWQIEQ